MATETTSVAKLKANLSHYLAKVRAGQTIEVTAHRKPVARITGITEHAPDALSRLIMEGRVCWGGGDKPRGASICLGDAARDLSDIVIEDRGP